MEENPLALIPAKARRVVYIVALVIGVAGPIFLHELDGIVATCVAAVIAVMALFSNAQALSIITPDEDNHVMEQHLARRAVEDENGEPTYSNW